MSTFTINPMEVAFNSDETPHRFRAAIFLVGSETPITEDRDTIEAVREAGEWMLPDPRVSYVVLFDMLENRRVDVLRLVA